MGVGLDATHSVSPDARSVSIFDGVWCPGGFGHDHAGFCGDDEFYVSLHDHVFSGDAGGVGAEPHSKWDRVYSGGCSGGRVERGHCAQQWQRGG